jgi:hypothetical protein
VELLDQGLRIIQVFLALPAVLRRRLSKPLDKVEPLAIANLCAHNILGLEVAVFFFLGLGLDRGRVGLERMRVSLDRSRLGLERSRVGLGILILLCGLYGTIRYSFASILFMLSEYSSDKMGRKARRVTSPLLWGREWSAAWLWRHLCSYETWIRGLGPGRAINKAVEG